MKKILVLRFSAMGDVVLLVPVLRSLVAHHANVEVTVVTRPKFASFFAGIERVVVFPADVDQKYTGFFGLRELFRAILTKNNYDVVIDMHDHIRTIFLRNLFKLFGFKTITFEKGRKEKKAFTRKENKIVKRLPHTIERYQKAFAKAGFSFPIIEGPHLFPTQEDYKNVDAWLAERELVKNEKWIGIAPFAMHKSKIWSPANYPQLINQLIQQLPARFFLFGGGAEEVNYFNDLVSLFPKHCVVVAGTMRLPQELALMKKLDLMVCVDSSNMHFAALTGTPILSIWGGTHPDLGFGPVGYGEESIVQISRDELPCRPCSVFGKETCHRGDFACINRIDPETIASRITSRLEQ